MPSTSPPPPPAAPTHDSCPVAVVGAGIVGLATALALLERGLGPVVVLEAEDRLGAHQSGRNSGVIHSGIYYRPGTLKARLCAQGRVLLEDFCAAQDIPFERCGKLIIATRPDQIPALAELESRAQANGLAGVRRIGAEEIREHEPHAAGLAALVVPQTGIVSFPRVVEALARCIGQRGGAVRLCSRVLDIRRESGWFVLQTASGAVRARNLVNCAGLHSDRIASMCGMRPRIRIVPFRGEYYLLRQESRRLVRHLIYPVPDPRFPFLGVHFTRRIDGSVEAGPNAVLALARHGYDWRCISPACIGGLLTYPGFWRMARRHARIGWMEVRRSLSRQRFARDLAELVPEIRAQDLVQPRAGVRAQAVDPSGKLVDDFALMEAPGMLHILNAPSPAATASLAIGRELALRAERLFRGSASAPVAQVPIRAGFAASPA